MNRLFNQLRDRISTLFFVSLLTISGIGLPSNQIKAEGTAQVMPNPAHGTALLIQPGTSSGPLLNAATENRVKFNIQDFTTENFYFGFNPRMRAPQTVSLATFSIGF